MKKPALTALLLLPSIAIPFVISFAADVTNTSVSTAEGLEA